MGLSNLTSRERVMLTLDHQEPDRVPLNMILTVDIYHRLRDHLGLQPKQDKSTNVWTSVSMDIDLIEAMGIDFCFIGLNSPSNKDLSLSSDGLIFDEWHIGRKKVAREDGSFYYEMVEHPLSNASLADIENFPWPDPYDPARSQELRKHAMKLRHDTDKALIGKFANSIWEQSWWLVGLSEWMLLMMTNPECAHAILNKVCETAIGFMDVGLNEIGDLIDIVRLSGEDLGTQQGPMISIDLYNQYVQPCFQNFWKLTKKKYLEKNPNGKLMIHSCGNIRPFIPSWIEMGLDILDPIQPRVVGMEPVSLKEEFGKDLVFHGGIDLQHILPFGSPDDVKREVWKYIKALSHAGGYIVAPAHNVQSDVPSENLVALRDAVNEFDRSANL